MPNLSLRSHASNLITTQYNGVDISFSNDGWFNATQVSARFNRNPHDWLRLPTTTQYLDALERKYGKISYLKTKRGKLGGGTWLHPKLGVRFAQWLDIDFAVWCDEQIDQILRQPTLTKENPEERKKARHLAAASYKVMTQMLKHRYEQEGKKAAICYLIKKFLLHEKKLDGRVQSSGQNTKHKRLSRPVSHAAFITSIDSIMVGCVANTRPERGIGPPTCAGFEHLAALSKGAKSKNSTRSLL